MFTFRKRFFLSILVFGFTIHSLFSQAIIVDHNHRDITTLSQSRIEQAKSALHIAYGHTSHGSQVTEGMSGLVAFVNGHGKGLWLPTDIFTWNNGGTGGALDLHDYAMGGDVGYYPQWLNNTISYLGTVNGDGRGSNHPDVNVIIWSWCGQAASQSEASMISNYLSPMTTLEAAYYGVTFVYMTGHADGSGLTGNLHIRNQQIRNYCITNNKVLYDFYDIECYDPDGDYFGDKYVDDACNYTGGNWATEWRAVHTEGTDWYSCGAAHTDYLNANQKAYAAWWLWVLIAERDISLAVRMIDFYAAADEGKGIAIHWETASEVNCIGFHILRSDIGEDAYHRLTESPISSQGNCSCGAEYCYVDSDMFPNKSYNYKIEVLFTDGKTEEYGPVQATAANRPDQCILYANYPNPFNPETSLIYSIPETGYVRLAIYNVTGREVCVLSEGILSAGIHESCWDGCDSAGCAVPSGIYISRLMTESTSIQQKMTLMK